MMSATRFRAAHQLARLTRSQQPQAQQQSMAAVAGRRFISSNEADHARTVQSTDTDSSRAPPTNQPRTTDPAAEPSELMQAPNRAGVWVRGQRPRSEAMTGPRFEQTDFSMQPQPKSAMALIHEQPVRWVHERVVACDGEGGGGPGGHPRIFINTDKPEICTCNYCGLPFANEHHRKALEAMPETGYPLQ